MLAFRRLINAFVLTVLFLAVVFGTATLIGSELVHYVFVGRAAAVDDASLLSTVLARSGAVTLAAGTCGVIAACVVLVFALLRSSSSLVRQSVSGLAHERLPIRHPLVEELTGLARRIGVAVPALYVVELGSNTALTWTAQSLVGDSLCMSAELLRRLSPHQRLWLFAKMLTHIGHHDSIAHGFLLTCRGASAFKSRLRALSASGGGSAGHFIVMCILLLPLLLIAHLFGLAESLARRVFCAVDVTAARVAEYRADAEASRIVGNDVGRSVLQQFNYPMEPNLVGFPSQLPSHRERAARLLELTTETSTNVR